jgi:hypothetical protein
LGFGILQNHEPTAELNAFVRLIHSYISAFSIE